MKKLCLSLALLVLLAALFLVGCEMLPGGSAGSGGTPCAHQFRLVSEQAPTCSESGFKLEKCELCAQNQNTVLPAVGHSYETVTVDPTCHSTGSVSKQCTVCGDVTLLSTTPALPHDTTSTVVDATCEEEGYTLSVCKDCSYSCVTDTVPALEHQYGEWVTVKEATEVSDGLRRRTCATCLAVEDAYILSNSYVDLTYIKEAFDADTQYEINSYEELSLKLHVAVLHLSETLTCRLNYAVGDLSALLNTLIEDYDGPFGFGISAGLQGDILSMSFTYQAAPLQSTGVIVYTQNDSVNATVSASARPADFDDFKINESLYTFPVTTSEQLVYALERGVRPICAEGSDAERAYAALKRLLIDIVDDSMTDEEKVKAIHDWLVMNVTYDAALYDLFGSVSNDTLKSYNGFYLEGVLFDRLAVCEGISKAFAALCNIEGIPCVCVEGYQTQNPGGVGHAWNKVYVNSCWYIVDATSDGTIINGREEVLSYQYYLIDEATYSTLYTGTTFTEIRCTQTLNAYADMYFVYQNTTYDLVIESQEELDSLVGYFESLDGVGVTVEFLLSFEVGETAADEISKAYRNNGYLTGCSYIENGNVVMLFQ